MLKFKVNDKVKVTSGKDKGREGNIERIIFGSFSAVVPGINEYKKHIKPRSGQKGGIVPIPRALPFSKIALVCPSCSKDTRVGFRTAGKEKVRFCKKCGKEISYKK